MTVSRLDRSREPGTDRDYSNGTSLSLLLRGRGLLGGFGDLFGKGDREYFQGYEAGQVIVTPSDTSLTIPDPNDRPYAGLLQAQAGTQLRLGYNLTDDFGTTLLRGFGAMPFPQYSSQEPAPKFGFYAFAGVGGTAVARNLTLDGNSFQDSPHVGKRPFLIDRWRPARF